ncbi:MAG: EamA family transporter [Gammaproteobacteria bacterium]
MTQPGAGTGLRMVAAWSVVYLVWGSTFLAIRIAVADLPPAMLAGVRFILAGLALGSLALARGQKIPTTLRQWRVCAIMGLALIVIGNGLVTWAEQWVPSNQAALIIASSALWTAWFGTFGPRGIALSGATRAGLVLGLAGVAMLVWPSSDVQAAPGGDLLWPKLAVLVSTLAWSGGVIYGRNAGTDLPPLMFAAAQMLVGGSVLTFIGLARGEIYLWQWTLPGIGGLLYLTVFGSCLAYATYIWLIGQTTPARLSTIAYVNPAVATVLGWWLLDETLGPLQLGGMMVVLAAVVWVSVSGRTRPARTR